MGLFSGLGDALGNLSVTTGAGTFALAGGKPSIALAGAQPQIPERTFVAPAPATPASVPWYKRPMVLVGIAAGAALVILSLRR